MNIASASEANIHQYADDTQLYVAVDKNDDDLSIDFFGEMIQRSRSKDGEIAVNDWMLHNGLALNSDNFEAIMFRTSQGIASSKIESATVAGSASTISDKVKSLTVTLDICLTFDSQVKATCKAIHYHARSLRHIWRLLSDTLAKSIVSSIVARLDYCNSLLVGTSYANFQRLQIVKMQLLVSSLEQENMNTFGRCCAHITGCLLSIG